MRKAFYWIYDTDNFHTKVKTWKIVWYCESKRVNINIKKKKYGLHVIALNRIVWYTPSLYWELLLYINKKFCFKDQNIWTNYNIRVTSFQYIWYTLSIFIFCYFILFFKTFFYLNLTIIRIIHWNWELWQKDFIQRNKN